MRPKSILYFERAYFASFSLDLLNFALFDFPDPEFGLVGSIIFYAAISAFMLWLWYMIAIRASRAMMWGYLAFTAFGIVLNLTFPEELFADGWASLTLTSAAAMLGFAAVFFLLRKDARRWFATNGQGEVDPKIFD